METITMYELLGLVKDGKAPKKIKIDNDILTLSKTPITQYNFERFGQLNWDYYIENNRLDEKNVEILDKDFKLEKIPKKEKKIPEKIKNYTANVGRVDDSNIEKYIHILFEQQSEIIHKFDELIDYLDYLNNKGDE